MDELYKLPLNKAVVKLGINHLKSYIKSEIKNIKNILWRQVNQSGLADFFI